MKKTYLVLIVTLFSWTYPANADIGFDTSDIVWVSTDITAPSRTDVFAPMLSYVQFVDGSFVDSFETYGLHIFPDSCDMSWECPDARSSAAHTTGNYKITSSGMTLSNVLQTGLIFDRATLENEVTAHTFSRSEREIRARIEDSVLLRETPEGVVRYLPFPMSGLDQIFGVHYFFEVAMVENAACVIAGLSQLNQVPLAEQTQTQQQLAALARLAAETWGDRKRAEELSKNYTLDQIDMPEAVWRELQIRLKLRSAYRIYENEVVRVASGQTSALTPEQVDVIKSGFDAQMERAIASDKAQFNMIWNRRLDDINIAMPLVVAIRNNDRTLQDTFCPTR